eukprot:10582663-Alexandrium_andersonii.AAC.1
MADHRTFHAEPQLRLPGAVRAHWPARSSPGRTPLGVPGASRAGSSSTLGCPFAERLPGVLEAPRAELRLYSQELNVRPFLR